MGLILQRRYQGRCSSDEGRGLKEWLCLVLRPEGNEGQKEALDKVCWTPELGLFSLCYQFLQEGKRVHLDLRKPHVSLQTGSAPFGVTGSLQFASLYKDSLPLLLLCCLCALQLGFADHVSVWPLSPDEPLGALHSALSLLGARCVCHSLALAEQPFLGTAPPP